MGSLEHSLSSLLVDGSVRVDGESSRIIARQQDYVTIGNGNVGIGGGSGGTILLFLRMLSLGELSTLSSSGGHGSHIGGGGGGGGRIHLHWSDIPTGDEYLPIASIGGEIIARF